jgi:hypothetical protein
MLENKLGWAPGSSPKTYMGTLVVDDMTEGPEFFMKLWAPKDDDDNDPAATKLADAMYDVVFALPDHTAESRNKLRAAMRAAGHKSRRAAYDDAAADLVHAGRFVEVKGGRGAIGYRAVPGTTVSQEKDQ